MKHYEKLLTKGMFSRTIDRTCRTATAANQVIYDYQKKGLIEKVKRFLCSNQHRNETTCILSLSDRLQSVFRCMYHTS